MPKIEEYRQALLEEESKLNQLLNSSSAIGASSSTDHSEVIFLRTKKKVADLYYALGSAMEESATTWEEWLEIARCYYKAIELAAHYLSLQKLNLSERKKVYSKADFEKKTIDMPQLPLSSAEDNFYTGLVYLCDIGEFLGHPKKAFDFVHKAASMGYVPAQNMLGDLYRRGIGVLFSNSYKAVEYYRKAEEQGYALAQNNLGWCYETGTGVTSNSKKAVKYYRKAAEQGYTLAQYNLGCCYETGIGITSDSKKAVEYYRKAAEQGISRAQCTLGWCYEKGIGVAIDLQTAVEWYQKAIRRSDDWRSNTAPRGRLQHIYDNAIGHLAVKCLASFALEDNAYFRTLSSATELSIGLNTLLCCSFLDYVSRKKYLDFCFKKLQDVSMRQTVFASPDMTQKALEQFANDRIRAACKALFKKRDKKLAIALLEQVPQGIPQYRDARMIIADIVYYTERDANHSLESAFRAAASWYEPFRQEFEKTEGVSLTEVSADQVDQWLDGRLYLERRDAEDPVCHETHQKQSKRQQSKRPKQPPSLTLFAPYTEYRHTKQHNHRLLRPSEMQLMRRF